MKLKYKIFTTLLFILPSFVIQAQLATVTTEPVYSVGQKIAFVYGEITYEGGSNISESGFCWNETGNPTFSDNSISNGETFGSFYSELETLTPNTTYYIRSYATNEDGTAYGNEETFTTFSEDAMVVVIKDLYGSSYSFGGAMNFTINWGDGNQTYNTGNATEYYNYTDSKGNYIVAFEGMLEEFHGMTFMNVSQILEIESFGNMGLIDVSEVGYLESRLHSVPSQLPSTITNVDKMFRSASIFNQDIGNWDMSNITSMQEMFAGTQEFNQDITNWDISNVKSLAKVFSFSKAFNQDISKWDVSKVTSFYGMFEGAKVFNQDISSWDVSNALNMSNMFDEAKAFNQDIGNWDVSNVTHMSGMFRDNTVFTHDLSKWNVSSVIEMGGMFAGSEYNGNIGNWDVSSVTNMAGMFNGSSFNQDISSWDVSSVTDMGQMFYFANSFNQDVSNWNVGNVIDMHQMFYYAHKFNQDVSNWNITKVPDFSNFVHGTDMSIHNYDKLLISWAGKPVMKNVKLSVGRVMYSSSAVAARNNLINNHGWIISDGGEGIAATGVTFEEGESIILDKNRSVILNITVLPTNASMTEISLTSSDTSIVKIIDEYIFRPVIRGGDKAGEAIVTVTTYDGAYIDQLKVIVGSTTSSKITKSNSILVYPTIMSNEVNIAGQGIQLIQILNVSGKVLYESSNISLNNTAVDVSGFNSGVYIVNVLRDEENFVSKIIKK